MSDEDIIRLFYRCIIKEAMSGRIDSFRYFNLPFNTVIKGDGVELSYRVLDDSPYFHKDFLIPTLYINNITQFNELLLEYVHEAIEFYDDSNYFPEVLTGEYYDEEKMISKEKYLICSLLANMTFDDFSNPYRFLERRIQMFHHPIIGTDEEIDLGYVETLKGRLILEERKERMSNETPYFLRLRIHSDEEDEDFYFPDIRIGICDDVSIFYAIQNEVENDKSSSYVKFVNRRVRKVDQGINMNEVENYDLKDITSSFMISALVGCLLSQNKTIEVLPLLIERWNAKQIANRYGASKAKDSQEYLEEHDEKQYMIQTNLSDKFMRLFNRLDYQIDGISCYFKDMTLYCKLSDSFHTDNFLLQEILDFMKESMEIHKKMS